MGSDSDLPVMQESLKILEEFKIPFELRIVSAHRTPNTMYEYAGSAIERGLKVIICGAGGSAHLPGMVASLTALPVIGVPIGSLKNTLGGVDSLYSIVQMPPGIPVATVAINGAKNAGILACSILSTANPELLSKLSDYKKKMSEEVDIKNNKLADVGYKFYFGNNTSQKKTRSP
jgi:5-(carboxyamino)imidazole ribonucleotide mutase